MKNSTETLLTCPTCNTKNFTERGLKAHRCKGVSRALSAVPSAPLVPSVASSDEDAVMGAQLTDQYQRAVGAMTEILKFGAMMMMLRERLSVLAPRVESKRSGSGRYAPGTGLKAWLKEHAPDVKEATAYRFMHIAEAVADKFTVKGKISFAELATKPADELPKAMQKKQLELWDFVNGTSRNSWLDQFKRDHREENGGHRERPNGTKRRTSDEKDFDDALTQALDWYALGVVGLKESYMHSDERWAVLPEVELANVADLVKLWAKKLDDICRSRKVVPSKLRDWDKDLNGEQI
jgi:hypothetical protein